MAPTQLSILLQVVSYTWMPGDVHYQPATGGIALSLMCVGFHPPSTILFNVVNPLPHVDNIIIIIVNYRIAIIVDGFACSFWPMVITQVIPHVLLLSRLLTHAISILG